MTQPQIYEGTLEEIAEQLRSAKLTGRFRAFLTPEPTRRVSIGEGKAGQEATQEAGQKRPSILGKYAGRIPSSDEFIREKQQEITREDRLLR